VGAIREDRLEGLYTPPEFAGQGVGAGLLDGMMTGRYDPLGQAKLPQGDAPALCGGSARGPQSPVDAVGNAVMADPTLMFQQ
jgi:putative acetyltransferase